MSNSPHHSFALDHAEIYGIECAILIEHFAHWIRVNRKLKRNFIENKTWTYQTLAEISAHFPYWSESQVFRIIKKLEELEVIIKGNFNKSKFDKVQWYAFKNEEMFTKSRNREIENTESLDPDHGIVRSINCTDTKPDILNTNREKPKPNPISRALFGSHVFLSKEEYDSLCTIHSKTKIDQCIEEINDYCQSKAKSYSSNGYAAAIRGWIRKEKEFKPDKPITIKMTNRESVMKDFEHGKKYNGAECFIGDESIAFQRGMNHMQLNFKELGFKVQLESMLRKMGITPGKPDGKQPKFKPSGEIIED